MKTYAEELIERGMERGMQQGKEGGERTFLLKLLRQRFGDLDSETEQRLATATTEQIETWGVRILSAATLAEVLTA